MITFLAATTISCRIHKFYAWILKVIILSVQLKDQFDERRGKKQINFEHVLPIMEVFLFIIHF
jgi:hypothetical protein